MDQTTPLQTPVQPPGPTPTPTDGGGWPAMAWGEGQTPTQTRAGQKYPETPVYAQQQQHAASAAPPAYYGGHYGLPSVQSAPCVEEEWHPVPFQNTSTYQSYLGTLLRPEHMPSQPYVQQNLYSPYAIGRPTPAPHSTPLNQYDTSNGEGGTRYASESQESLLQARAPGDVPIGISFEKITYAVKVKVKDEHGKTQRKKKERIILDDLSGTVLPGRLLVILGPSGSGKTTLLTRIAGRLRAKNKKGSKNKGKVFLNQLEWDARWRRAISVVTQDDVVYETATPRESFAFAVRNKSNVEKKDDKEVKKRVEDTARRLGLMGCIDTVIGTPGIKRGLSGGERKRTNIGVELITDAPVMILDEPTSGLDSAFALQVLRILHSLTTRGATVVCTLHQPSSQMLEYIDDIMLMAPGGKIVYHGPAADMLPYLKSVGHQCPPMYNPTDFAMRLLHNHVDQLLEAWKTNAPQRIADPKVGLSLVTPTYAREHPELQNLFPSKDATEKKLEKYLESVNTGFGTQLRTNLRRTLINFKRHRNLARVRLGQTLIFGLLIGFIYFNLPTSQRGVGDRMGLIFLVLVNGGMSAMIAGATAYPEERAIFLREQAGALYSPFAYGFAKLVSDLPANTIGAIIFGTLTYWIAGLDADFGHFMVFLLALWLIINALTALGLLLGTVLPNAQAATAILPAVTFPLYLASGLMISEDRLKPGWTWLQAISLFRYSFIPMVKNEIGSMGPIPCNPAKGDLCVFQSGDDALAQFGFASSNSWMLLLILGIICVGLRILTIFGMMLAAKRVKF